MQQGLSFLLIKSPFPTSRSEGSATWAGLANLYWTADRSLGVANMVAASELPYGQSRVINAWLGAEGIVYAHKAAQESDALANGLKKVAL